MSKYYWVYAKDKSRRFLQKDLKLRIVAIVQERLESETQLEN